MNNDFQGFAVATAIGLLFFGLGLAARIGYLKRMFITRGMPGVYPKSTVYAMMPSGLFFLAFLPIFLCAGANALDEGPSAIILFGLAGLAIVSLIWQPRWLKPYWLRWLEEHYGHVLEEMFEEARQMGVYEWEAQVETQADLEQWADRVARKHGWQRLR